MRDTAFIVTKPLQLLVALAIIKQLNVQEKTYLIIVDSFYNAKLVYERIRSADWEFSETSVEFFQSLDGAYHFAGECGAKSLFIDADVGVRKYFTLLRLKLKRRIQNINVYEEGLGTYRIDLYAGTKKTLLDLVGIGTRFGGCSLTNCIHLYEPETYRKNFPKHKASIKKIKYRPKDIIQLYFPHLNYIFDGDNITNNSSESCHVYLSSWHVDYNFMKIFSSLPGDKYLKLHPHIKTIEKINCGTLASRTAPAEMILMSLKEKYRFVNVFHHGSSVERYISAKNINFIRV